jgi:pimeloyl-ACP methyl ester carboxylesterase
MEVEVNGTRIWFDVDGPALVPDGPVMHRRPTIVLVHGGPGSYDHSYFKPDFEPLTHDAQVIYLDLRDHGRSARQDAAAWTFEVCADDVRAFCDVLGITKPIVYGHSMGGFVAMLYGARHPGHAAALVLQSTMARFDLERLVKGFRRFGGDEVAEIARRDFGGDPVTDAESDLVYAAFGPRVPDQQQLARRIGNSEVGLQGMDALRNLDIVDQLSNLDCPTLVCVGELDPVTPVEASREIFEALPRGVGSLKVIGGAGHFPWKDRPDRYWPLLSKFIAQPTARPSPA